MHFNMINIYRDGGDPKGRRIDANINFSKGTIEVFDYLHIITLKSAKILFTKLWNIYSMIIDWIFFFFHMVHKLRACLLLWENLFSKNNNNYYFLISPSFFFIYCAIKNILSIFFHMLHKLRACLLLWENLFSKNNNNNLKDKITFIIVTLIVIFEPFDKKKSF